MAFNLSEEQTGEARFSAEGDTITIAGKINQLNPEEFLGPFLDKAMVQSHDVDPIIIDITLLEFLNSSGIGAIIKRIRDRREGQKVIVRTGVANWQKKSVNIFRLLDPENIAIE